MPKLSIQLRADQRLAIFDEDGNAELIDIDNQRDEAGELVITDHVLIPNTFGCDDIYDDVSAYFRGDPVRALPANTLGAANDFMTPALLEVADDAPAASNLYLVA